MAQKQTATYILVGVLAIPAITLAVLLVVAGMFSRWYELIGPVLAIYFFSFLASVWVRKATGKKTGNLRKSLTWILIKTACFTFGIITAICNIVSGGEPMFAVQWPHADVNLVYLIALLVAWAIMACVNEVMIK